MLEKNRTTREYAGSTRGREIAAARLSAKLVANDAVAAAHRRATGPAVTASQEAQPQPDRPKINVPG